MNKAAQDHYNSFDDFWSSLLAAAEVAKQKKTAAPILKLLNRQAGFVPNEAQVKQMHQAIHELPHSDALQFSIFVLAKTRRLPSRVMSALADHIWIGYKEISEFPDIDHPTWVDVREWLTSRLSRVFSEKQDSFAVARSIFASLIPMRERDFYVNALLLFADILGERTNSKRLSEQNELEGVLAELLRKPKVSRGNVALVGRSGRVMREAVDAALDQRRQATAKSDLLQQEITRLHIELQHKTAEVKEQNEALAALKSRLAAAEKELEAAHGRVVGTEEHWNVVSKQQLAGVLSRLRGEIEHETKEILFSLDRTKPNTEMAIQRVRRIEKILQKADNTQ